MCADDFILRKVPGDKFTAGLLFFKKTVKYISLGITNNYRKAFTWEPV